VSSETFSKVDQLGLATMPSVPIKPSRLADSQVQIECKLERIIELGDAPNHSVIGGTALIHVRLDLALDGKIDSKTCAGRAHRGAITCVSGMSWSVKDGRG
jgi:flavin reductase (DIM6/NTAB) family NADH-FMN oxidoreductase RutF